MNQSDLLDRYAQLIVRSGVNIAPGQELVMTAPVDALPLVRRITEHAYVDGGMHPSFRAQLKRYGAKSFSAKTSVRKYPVSRPDAALADPFEPAN